MGVAKRAKRATFTYAKIHIKLVMSDSKPHSAIGGSHQLISNDVIDLIGQLIDLSNRQYRHLLD